MEKPLFPKCLVKNCRKDGVMSVNGVQFYCEFHYSEMMNKKIQTHKAFVDLDKREIEMVVDWKKLAAEAYKEEIWNKSQFYKGKAKTLLE